MATPDTGAPARRRRVPHWAGGRIVADARARAPHYCHDWRSGWDVGPHILAPAVHVWLLSLIPALAFSEQMLAETGGAVGFSQVLISTAAFGIIQAIAGGQPLLIVGVAEPVVVIYGFMYRWAARSGLDFLAWAAWVAVFTALAIALLAAAGAAAYVSRFTRFAGDTFGAIVAALFVTQGVKISLSLFRPAGGDAGWAAADGAWSLLLAAGVCCTALGLRSARRWRTGTAAVRGLVADYGAPAAVLLWTALSYAILGVRPPASIAIPRRLSVLPPWTDTGFWSTAARMGSVPGWAVAAALPPAAVVAVLFYFDHSVSAQVAVSVVEDGADKGRHARPKPVCYSWDLLLLALSTLAAGVAGLPPTNGVLPQAPMHAHALAVAAGAADAAAERAAARKRGAGEAAGAPPPLPLDAPVTPPRPLETRLAALLQALAVGGAAFAAPALAVIPRGVIAGYFVFMAIEWVVPSQAAHRVAWLATGAAGRAAAAAAPGADPWRAASASAVRRFTLLQAAVAAAVFALTFAPYAGIAFPLPIMALVPLRHRVMPRWFDGADLELLDAGRGEGEGAGGAGAAA